MSSTPRFFIEGTHRVGDAVHFGRADARKIATVLRLHGGDSVEVFDSASRTFDALLSGDGAAQLVALRDDPRESPLPAITLAQSVPKAQKMDFVVEKLTELGVAAIVPMHSERTIVATIGEAKLARWQRLAKSAAQQCGRTTLPKIESSATFPEIVQRFPQFDVVLFAWELADAVPARDVLPQWIEGAGSVLILIGPEGGFSHDEARIAQDAGAKALSLGTHVLRTETAGLVAVAYVAFCAVK